MLEKILNKFKEKLKFNQLSVIQILFSYEMLLKETILFTFFLNMLLMVNYLIKLVIFHFILFEFICNKFEILVPDVGVDEVVAHFFFKQLINAVVNFFSFFFFFLSFQ